MFSIALLLLAHLSGVLGHGLMNSPNPRGCLSATKNRFIFNTVTEDASHDFRAHSPAGDRNSGPGGGRRYQKAVVAPHPWTPFEPLDPNHRWRFGVCGDKVTGNEHLKGGEFYDNATIVATYKQGGFIDVGLTIVAHHNGFIELHICDVAKCPGGDISERCFAEGHCRQLKRRRNRVCDSGLSKDCAPIDRNHPGRWYLPCSRPNKGRSFDVYGNDGTILYDLPEDLTCEHCVIQWYWTAANFCNPPDTIEYFEGPDGPKNWGKCRGQAGAVGGYNPNKRVCGATFPEEYAQCADIRIDPRTGTNPAPAPEKSPVSSMAPTVTPTPMVSDSMTPTLEPRFTSVATWTPEPSSSMVLTTPSPEAGTPDDSGSPDDHAQPPVSDYEIGKKRRQGHGGVRDLVLVADGVRILSLNAFRMVDVSEYKHVTIEAIVEDDVSRVSFSVGGRRFIDTKRPFYLFGDMDGEPVYNDDLLVNKDIVVRARAKGDSDAVAIRLYR